MQIERARQHLLNTRDVFVRETPAPQRLWVNVRRAFKRSCSHEMRDNRLSLLERIAQFLQSLAHTLVHNFHVAAASQFLKLHEREFGFNPCRIAVHQKRDGASRRDNANLGVPIPPFFAYR